MISCGKKDDDDDTDDADDRDDADDGDDADGGDDTDDGNDKDDNDNNAWTSCMEQMEHHVCFLLSVAWIVGLGLHDG